MFQNAGGSNSIHIFLTGKTGNGKSSLVNAIIGETVCEEGKYLYGVTREVTKHDATVNDVQFVVWDSPGLQDITEDDVVITNRIKKKLKKNCTHLHLTIYTIRMDRDRVEKSEIDAIKHLTDIFSVKFWDNAVFALTFANRVLPPMECESEINDAEWFHTRVKEFKDVIRRALVESGISKKKADNVPVIPAGYYKPTTYMQDPKRLFDIPDWLIPFWQTCATHTKETEVMPLIRSQKNDVINEDEGQIQKQEENGIESYQTNELENDEEEDEKCQAYEQEKSGLDEYDSQAHDEPEKSSSQNMEDGIEDNKYLVDKQEVNQLDEEAYHESENEFEELITPDKREEKGNDDQLQSQNGILQFTVSHL